MRSAIRRLIDWLGGHELGVLVAATGVVLSLWFFLAIAGLVAEGDTKKFDEHLLLRLRVANQPEKPIGPEWLPEAARDVTALGSTVVLWGMTAAVAGFLLLDRRYRAMGFVIAAVLSGWALSFALKLAFSRPRPDLVPHLMRAYFSSFPSGHSMMSAVVYGTLGSQLSGLVTRRGLKVYFLAIAATAAGLVGISRVYLGVHYPTDVLAGWSAGLAWSTLCWLIGRKFRQDGTIEPTV